MASGGIGVVSIGVLFILVMCDVRLLGRLLSSDGNGNWGKKGCV